MEKRTVQFLPHQRSIQVSSGETILRAALEAGVHINASCGGEGVCGKCRVLLEKGKVSGGTSEKISSEDQEKDYRLACKATVIEDIVIRVPVESEMDLAALKRPQTARRTARIIQPPLVGLKEEKPFSPPVEKKYIELPEPSVGDNMPDSTRLVKALSREHGEHRLVIDINVMQKLPEVLRQSEFKITITLLRPVQNGRKTHIIDIASGDTTNRHFAVAMDIGTTTVQGRLLDLNTGKAVAIGLLPEINQDKVDYIGNSSLLGAEYCAVANHLRSEVVELANRITNFELSETPSFMDHFTAALFLPHTDLDRFPKLKVRLKNRKIDN